MAESFIQAPPGWYLVYAIVDSEDEKPPREGYRIPVLGWRIAKNGEVGMPVVPSLCAGEADGLDRSDELSLAKNGAAIVLVDPMGHVWFGCDNHWPNMQLALNDLRTMFKIQIGDGE